MTEPSWLQIERDLASVIPQTWETITQRYDNVFPIINKTIEDSQSDIRKYPRMNGNGEQLAQLLANLNYYVEKLGELHAVTEALKTWTDKRYDIEKALAAVNVVKSGKPTTYANNAKYEVAQNFLDKMVMAASLHLRVQNQRSSARDTTEALRSRIGQLRGQLRS